MAWEVFAYPRHPCPDYRVVVQPSVQDPDGRGDGAVADRLIFVGWIADLGRSDRPRPDDHNFAVPAEHWGPRCNVDV